jgi:ABC-type multidrug transport system ATPase subunit
MDEPFGALDEITRNKLNLELLKIWEKLKITAILVTHSLSEATFLSDRVAVLSERPAKIKEIIDIKTPRPRTKSMRETSRLYEGLEDIGSLFEELFEGNKGSEVLVLGLNQFLKEERFVKFFGDYHEKRKKSNIKLKLVLSEDIKSTIEKKYRSAGLYDKGDKIRYSKYKFPNGVFIIGDHVINIMTDKVVTAVDVKSKQNAERYKSFFNTFWRKK